MGHRWRVTLGFVALAALVGIGVVPVRRGLTVRYRAAPAARPSRRPRRSVRRWLSRLLRRRLPHVRRRAR